MQTPDEAVAAAQCGGDNIGCTPSEPGLQARLAGYARAIFDALPAGVVKVARCRSTTILARFEAMVRAVRRTFCTLRARAGELPPVRCGTLRGAAARVQIMQAISVAGQRRWTSAQLSRCRGLSAARHAGADIGGMAHRARTRWALSPADRRGARSRLFWRAGCRGRTSPRRSARAALGASIR